ncbi:MAG TPA: hypothetical protein VFX24_00580 [Ktedonobacterales bacterium]|jgi:hypothetical protein|nr:hypothetical protein [Ktedonobacterales bacterium]
MEGRYIRRWQSYLLGFGLVALLVASFTACGRSAPATSVTSLFATDALYVEVMQHVATPYQDQSIFSRTIRDKTTIAQVRQDIASVDITSPDAVFYCPVGLLNYSVYNLKFYQAANLVDVVTINATDCQFIKVKDIGTGATEEHCCPGSDFWTQLRQLTGAPLPE